MIAVVTNFYNPSKKYIKIKNYYTFKEKLGTKLYTIEAAFGNEPFVLPKDDGMFQVRCKNLIWQQYTLVNLVIKMLPDKYDKVVWVDADIIFEDQNWLETIDDMLDDYKIVQNYSKASLLYSDGSVVEEKESVAANALETLKDPKIDSFSSSLDMSSKHATGFSWGVRREVIEKHGIYEHWITGSCDNAFVLGIWGDWENNFIKTRLNQKMKDHFFEWAIPFHEYIDKNVSYRIGSIKHLWHGMRNYKKRWNCLQNFNPYKDLGHGENGTLEWKSDNTCLQKCCEKMCLNYDDIIFKL
jgi:hypothetical protein